MITLSGLMRKKEGMEAAVTESTEAASGRIGVCPWIVSLDYAGKYQRVPVRLYNMSAKILTSSALCELQEVKVLRNPDIGNTKSDTAQSQQQVVGNKASDKPVQIPDGLNLDDCYINNQPKEQLRNFTFRWNDSFLNDITDFGSCDLLKYEINLTDNVPFKEPARRIPPALFQGVKDHLHGSWSYETKSKSILFKCSNCLDE